MVSFLQTPILQAINLCQLFSFFVFNYLPKVVYKYISESHFKLIILVLYTMFSDLNKEKHKNIQFIKLRETKTENQNNRLFFLFLAVNRDTEQLATV